MRGEPGVPSVNTVAGPRPNTPGYLFDLEVKKRRVDLVLEEKMRALKEVEAHLTQAEKRARGLADFFYFTREIMGFKDLHPPLHGELCEFMAHEEEDWREKLVLIPRGCFKSTICSISYPVWKLLRNPEERIAILSVKANLAETFMREIVLRIDDPKFQALYGDLIGSSSTWPLSRAGEVRLPRVGSKTGPSLFITSVESSEVGYHFSIMIYDDIVNEANCSSPEQLEKTWEWFTRQIAVLDPGGEQVVVGTRWHWDDTYGRIEKIGTWKRFFRSIYDEKKESIFPTLLPTKKLKEYERRLGTKFAMFYLNDPTGCGQNRFDLKKFQWVDYEERDPESWRYIIVDPATTTNEWSCPTGIVIADARPDQTCTIVEAISTKQDPEVLVASLIELIREHKPHQVVIETEAALNTVFFWLKTRLREEGMWCDVKDIKNSHRIRKDVRPGDLLVAVNEGRIKFRKGMTGAKVVERECMTFPKGETDDVLVCLSFIPQHVKYPPHYKRTEQVEKFKSNDARARRIAFLMQYHEEHEHRARKRIPRMRDRRARQLYGELTR